MPEPKTIKVTTVGPGVRNTIEGEWKAWCATAMVDGVVRAMAYGSTEAEALTKLNLRLVEKGLLTNG